MLFARTDIEGESPPPAAEQLEDLAGREVFSSETTYPKGTEVFGEGEEANFVYRIATGAVRTYKLLSDGRRQINAFHLPGDVFGVEDGMTHRFTAEAIVKTRLRMIRRSSLFDKATTRITADTNKLISLASRNLRHAENHILLLGRKTSRERVAAFLLEMDQRLGHPHEMILPMNRRDIADYLGLTLETVSRAFSLLRDKEMLQFDESTHRQLRLLDRKGLARFDA